MKLHYISLSFLTILSVAILSCGKDSQISTPGNSSTPVVPFESLVSFKTIPLPTVNLNMGIIPNLKDFYVTNKGPYVQIQNTSQQRWSVYKYQGESGSNSWSSFIPNYTSQYFIPNFIYVDSPKKGEACFRWKQCAKCSWTPRIARNFEIK